MCPISSRVRSLLSLECDSLHDSIEKRSDRLHQRDTHSRGHRIHHWCATELPSTSLSPLSAFEATRLDSMVGETDLQSTQSIECTVCHSAASSYNERTRARAGCGPSVVCFLPACVCVLLCVALVVSIVSAPSNTANRRSISCSFVPCCSLYPTNTQQP